ncbi:hypothetical protein HanIR_Chr16g0812161 [Helianthus annuus]|nr:hypothetical protein HanIR_Chr16g0812161 [Helianthus annuus]
MLLLALLMVIIQLGFYETRIAYYSWRGAKGVPFCSHPWLICLKIQWYPSMRFKKAFETEDLFIISLVYLHGFVCSCR